MKDLEVRFSTGESATFRSPSNVADLTSNINLIATSTMLVPNLYLFGASSDLVRENGVITNLAGRVRISFDSTPPQTVRALPQTLPPLPPWPSYFELGTVITSGSLAGLYHFILAELTSLTLAPTP